MRDLINIVEGVALHSEIALAAFILTVAEAYDAAPLHDPKAVASWKALNKSTTETMFQKIEKSGIKIVYVDTDPLTKFSNDLIMITKLLLYDLVINHRILVYTGDSEHPEFPIQVRLK